jgi:hypothetical protein
MNIYMLKKRSNSLSTTTFTIDINYHNDLQILYVRYLKKMQSSFKRQRYDSYNNIKMKTQLTEGL